MVGKVLVRGMLTFEMKEAGAELITRLDKAGLTVTTSFWQYLPESDVWRLIIASPEVERDGPTSIYKKIKPILSKIPMEKRLDLKDISVVQRDDPLIDSLRKGIKTNSGISGISVKGSAFNGRFFDDAFIYRST
jgi:hypothetical protein